MGISKKERKAYKKGVKKRDLLIKHNALYLSTGKIYRYFDTQSETDAYDDGVKGRDTGKY